MRNFTLGSFGLLLLSVVFVASPSFAAPSIVCRFPDGSLQIRKEGACTRRGGTAATVQSLDQSPVLCFANIAGSQGASASVRSFGGASTTGVTVSYVGAGHFTVTCSGTYTGITGTDDITPMTSMLDTDNYDVASLSMDAGSASENQIVLDVWTWETKDDTADLVDRDFSVVVLADR